MSNEPHVITLQQVSNLLVGLGLDPDLKNLRSVHMEGQCVTVVRNRRNDEGLHYVVGDELATETTTIRLQP